MARYSRAEYKLCSSNPHQKKFVQRLGRRFQILLHQTCMFCSVALILASESAAVGHHFARPPGNRFWRSLHAASFTERLLTPFADRDLLQFGYGLRNIVDRATARADELDAEEMLIGQRQLAAKVQYYRPRSLFLFTSRDRVACQGRSLASSPSLNLSPCAIDT